MLATPWDKSFFALDTQVFISNVYVSVPGSVLIKATLMKSPAEAFWCCPDRVLENKYGQ